MSTYETVARQWWAQQRPAELSLMDDPETFFSTLAAQIEGRIAELQPQIAGPDLPGEAYLAKAGRLNAAQAQAREIALDELVWSLGPESPEQEEPSVQGRDILELHRLASEALI